MNINLDDTYINKKIEKCEDLFKCNTYYKNILIEIENIEEWFENELKEGGKILGVSQTLADAWESLKKIL